MKQFVLKMKWIITRNSMFLRILISYIIIGAIILALLSYSLLAKFTTKSMENMDDLSNIMLQQADQSTDQLLRYIFSYYYELYRNDPDILNGLNSDTLVSKEKIDIYQKLNRPIISNTLIHSVLIFNPKADLVISSMDSIRSVADYREKDQSLASIIQENEFPNGFLIIPRKVKSVASNANVISLIFTENQKGSKSALVVNLSQSVLQQMVIKSDGSSVYTLLVIDKDGFVIAHQNPEMINTNLGNEAYVRRILSSAVKQDHFNTHIGEAPFHVSYLKSEGWGWTFVNMGEERKLLYQINGLQRDVLLTTLLFIFVAVNVGLFFTSNIYLPIRKLLRKINADHLPELGRSMIGETALLESTYDQLYGSIHQALPAKKKELLRQVLLGTYMSENELKYDLVRLLPDFQSPCYIVCVLRLDNYRETIRNNSRWGIGLLYFALSNIAQEVFSASFKTDIVELEQDHLCIIVGLQAEALSEMEKLEEAIRTTQQLLNRYYHISITGGMGSHVTEIEKIAESYKGAFEASQYRILFGREAVIRYDEISSLASRSYEYPAAIEAKLLNELRLGNETGVIKELDSFIDAIHDFSSDGILLSMTQLTVASVQMLKKMMNIENYGIDLSYKTLQDKLHSLDTINSIRDWLVSLFSSCISLSASRQENKRGEFVNQIIHFVQERYHDDNLSLLMISDYVGLSPNYVRVTFKELTKQSLSDYINELRFQKATELLKSTDMTAAKICGLVGFSNPNYFYTAFKKYIGKTPDQYRKDWIRTGGSENGL